MRYESKLSHTHTPFAVSVLQAALCPQTEKTEKTLAQVFGLQKKQWHKLFGLQKKQWHKLFGLQKKTMAQAFWFTEKNNGTSFLEIHEKSWYKRKMNWWFNFTKN